MMASHWVWLLGLSPTIYWSMLACPFWSWSRFGLLGSGCCCSGKRGATGGRAALAGKYLLLDQPVGYASGLSMCCLNLLGTLTLQFLVQFGLPSVLGFVRHSISKISKGSVSLNSSLMFSDTLTSTSLIISSVDLGWVLPTKTSYGAASPPATLT